LTKKSSVILDIGWLLSHHVCGVAVAMSLLTASEGPPSLTQSTSDGSYNPTIIDASLSGGGSGVLRVTGSSFDSIKKTKKRKATLAQLNRAAGSQCTAALQEALEGWTAAEVDRAAADLAKAGVVDDNDGGGRSSCGGKNPVHVAAWRGSIDNLRLLVDEVGCNVNTIATGTHSFGKTPIFFAATRCRDDVVSFLLGRGASVKIVNNKGQTVLSLAASHLLQSTVDAIVRAESDQQGQDWVNYRLTHSDGLEYGDLDPRFLRGPRHERIKENDDETDARGQWNRELRPTDVVTRYAVNPTTKQSRRGSFLRRNPHLEQEQKIPSTLPSDATSITQRKVKAKKKRRDDLVVSLSAGQTVNLRDAWKVLESSQQHRAIESISAALDSSASAFLTVVQLNAVYRQPWIADIASRLKKTIPDPVDRDQLIQATVDLCVCGEAGKGENSRILSLLHRLKCHTLGLETSTIPLPAASQTSPARALGADEAKDVKKVENACGFHRTQPLDSPVWKEACRYVSDLSIQVFMPACEYIATNGRDASRAACMLQLPVPPTWIDTIDGLEKLRQSLASEPLVAFDTEWTNVNGHCPSTPACTVISTLQLAVNEKQSWLIDLVCSFGDYDDHYRSLCCELVEELFRTKIMLGFALGRDLAKLEEWLRRSLNRSRCLDLQHYFSSNKSNAPGLASCTFQVLRKIQEARDAFPISYERTCRVYQLDKTQQCSDWSRRPLANSQLTYAALDAAILPFLLAEQRRMMGTQVDPVGKRQWSDAD
jgi:hypothetical protein